MTEQALCPPQWSRSRLGQGLLRPGGL